MERLFFEGRWLDVVVVGSIEEFEIETVLDDGQQVDLSDDEFAALYEALEQKAESDRQEI